MKDGNTVTTTINYTGATFIVEYSMSGNTLTATVLDYHTIPVTVDGETHLIYTDVSMVFTKA